MSWLPSRHRSASTHGRQATSTARSGISAMPTNTGRLPRPRAAARQWRPRSRRRPRRQVEALGADQVITIAFDTHIQAKQRGDDDYGPAGAFAPPRQWHLRLATAPRRARLVTGEFLEVPQVLPGGDPALQPLGAPKLPLLPPPPEGNCQPLTHRPAGRAGRHAQRTWRRGHHWPIVVRARSRGHQPSSARSPSCNKQSGGTDF